MADPFLYEVKTATGTVLQAESPVSLSDEDLDELAASPSSEGVVAPIIRGAAQYNVDRASYVGRVLERTGLPGADALGKVKSFFESVVQKYPRPQGAGYWTDVGEGLGQVGQQSVEALASGSLAKVVGFGTKAALQLASATGLGGMFPAEAESATKGELARQEAAGETPNEDVALVKGAAYATYATVVEKYLKFGKWVGKLEKAIGLDATQKTLKEVAKRIIAETPETVLANSSGEFFQRLGEDLITSGKVDLPAAGYEALVAAPIGFGAGAVATGAGALTKSETAPVAERSDPTRQADEPFAMLSGPRVLRDSKLSGFSATTPIDSMQMLARLRNKLTPGEMAAYEQAGLQQFLGQEKKTPGDVAKWMEENGPKVEVDVWGDGEEETQVQARRNQIAHQLDTMRPDWREIGQDEVAEMPNAFRNLWEEYTAPNEWGETEDNVYQSTAPSSTPVKVLAVRAEGPTLFEDPHFSRKKNTLGFSRYQVETLPSGEKVMHVIEVQSDWEASHQKAVKVNEEWNTKSKDFQREIPALPHPLLKDYNRLVLKALVEQARKEGVDRIVVSDAATAMMTEGHDAVAGMVEPVNVTKVARIGKAAEAYGNDWSDGRYLQVLGDGNAAGIYRVDKPESNNPSFVDREVARELAASFKEGYVYGEVPQEPGMRFNYGKEFYITDQKGNQLAQEYFSTKEDAETFAKNRVAGLGLKQGEFNVHQGQLHEIMRELTGDVGEKVTVGEHQKAFGTRGVQTGAEGIREQQVLRSNLVFQEGGKPKTTSTGLAYRLPSRTKPFALFGKNLTPTQQVPWTETRKNADQHSREMLAMFNLKDRSKVQDVLSALKLNMLNTPELRELAAFLDRHFGEVLTGKVISIKGTAMYHLGGDVYIGDDWLQRPAALLAEKLMHEIAHAATARVITNPTAEQRTAVERIKQAFRKAEASLSSEERVHLANMRAFYEEFRLDATHENQKRLVKKWGLDTLDAKVADKLYLLATDAEFIAGIFESGEFRNWLNSIKMGDSTLLQRVKEWILQALGIEPGSALDHTFQGLIEMGEALGKVNVRVPAQSVDPTLFPFRGGSNDVYPDHRPITEVNDETEKLFASEKVARWLADLGKKVGHPMLTEWIATLQGGKARMTMPAHVALATYAVEANGTARAFASLWGERLASKIDKLFGADKEGNLTKVKALKKGLSLKLSDVIGTLRVDPKAYQLTVEQWAAVKVLHAISDRVEQLSLEYKFIKKANVNPEYFFRRALEVPDVEKSAGGYGVGARATMHHKRFFTEERDGWKAGIKYETSIERAVVSSLEDLGRSIAAYRLAHNPLLSWQTRKSLEKQMLREAAKRKGSALTAAEEKDVKEQAGLRADKMQVRGVKAFQNRLFDPKIARMINKEFEAEISRLRKWLLNANSFAKGLQFGMDFGVGQLQLLPTLMSNPIVWLKTQGMAMGAFASPQVFQQYLEQPKNFKAAKEIAQYGHTIGNPLEHLSGLTKGQWLTELSLFDKLPFTRPLRILRHIPKAFGRHFQTALDVAFLELWKAQSPYVPKSQWSSLVKSLESQLLSSRMESGNLTHSRATWERLLMLAPSYYRGAVDFVARLITEKGSVSKEAWKSVGSFVFGSVAMYWGIGLALGMDRDELLRRMNPSSSEFMLWRMTDGEQQLNFGPGGIFRSMLRLLGNMWQASKEHGADTKFWVSKDNPAMKWYRGHSAPAVGLTWSSITGKDYMGEEMAGFGAVSSILKPVSFQGRSTAERLTGVVGLTAFPEGVKKFETRQIEQKAGASVKNLTYGERMQASSQVRGQVKRYEEFQEAGARKRGAIYAVEQAQKRAEKLQEDLPKDVRSWVKRWNLEVPGYSTSFRRGPVNLPLAQEEYGTLHSAMLAGYERMFRMLMEDSAFERQEHETQQKRLSIMLEAARKQVRGEFLSHLGTKTDK